METSGADIPELEGIPTLLVASVDAAQSGEATVQDDTVS